MHVHTLIQCSKIMMLLLQHVLKDKRVINLAKKMTEEEETDSEDIVVYVSVAV